MFFIKLALSNFLIIKKSYFLNSKEFQYFNSLIIIPSGRLKYNFQLILTVMGIFFVH